MYRRSYLQKHLSIHIYRPVIDQLKLINIMAYKSFQESLIWQKSEALLLALSREMLQEEAAWMRKRMMTTILSASQLIAKGYEKRKKKELIRHLVLSNNQVRKLRTILTMSTDLGYLDAEDAEAYVDQSLELTKLILGLVRHLSTPKEEAQRA
jgi:four helix bundle protein